MRLAEYFIDAVKDRLESFSPRPHLITGSTDEPSDNILMYRKYFSCYVINQFGDVTLFRDDDFGSDTETHVSKSKKDKVLKEVLNHLKGGNRRIPDGFMFLLDYSKSHNQQHLTHT